MRLHGDAYQKEKKSLLARRSSLAENPPLRTREVGGVHRIAEEFPSAFYILSGLNTAASRQAPGIRIERIQMQIRF
jgi:hypothetical protein